MFATLIKRYSEEIVFLVRWPVLFLRVAEVS
jgi:hypothetical protein